MLTLQTSFQTTFAQGGAGEYNPLVEMTVNSKEENCQDFCPNYVQEFGLSFQVLPPTCELDLIPPPSLQNGGSLPLAEEEEGEEHFMEGVE